MNESFVIGDRVSYLDRKGVVIRISILGMKPCCALQVKWDDNKSQTILQMNQIKDVVKL